jgi:hypothetical protein
MAAQSDCLHVATSPSARHCATIKMRTHLAKLDCRLRCLDGLTSAHAVAYVQIAFAFTARDF